MARRGVWVRIIVRAIALFLVLSTFSIAPVLANDTVGMGYTSSGKHFRYNRSDDRLLWSTVHFAVLETCSYGADYLATASQTRSWTSFSSAAVKHSLYTKSGLKTHGTMNAGSHHFYTWAGNDVWSPGGENGWDTCWP